MLARVHAGVYVMCTLFFLLFALVMYLAIRWELHERDEFVNECMKYEARYKCLMYWHRVNT